MNIHWVLSEFDPDDPLLPDSCSTLFADLEPLRTTTGVPDVVVVHAVPEMLPFLARISPPGVPLVSHTVWEAPELQAHWPGLLNECAGVVVPTKWNAESFVRAGVSVPIGVVPHAVNADGPDSNDDAWLGPAGIDTGSSFVVHSVAAWIPRKAPWLTVETYARAFGPDDDTLLVLHTNSHLGHGVPLPPGPESRSRLTSWSVAKILHHQRPTGRVHLEHRMRTRSELDALHRRSDCWLSLPHSEGWNLGAFDAAAEGTPVVTTGYGGPTEYLDADVSYLVPGRRCPRQTVSERAGSTPTSTLPSRRSGVYGAIPRAIPWPRSHNEIDSVVATLHRSWPAHSWSSWARSASPDPWRPRNSGHYSRFPVPGHCESVRSSICAVASLLT